MLTRRRVLGAAGALALTGCGPERRESAPEAPQRAVWPLPPAPPRVIYEHTLRSSRDVEAESETDRLRALLAGGERSEFRLEKPFAVAAAAGRVYVTDSVVRLVHAFDVPRRRYFNFGFRREGRLAKPLGVAVDGVGSVYVADSTAKRVVAYDALGLYRAEFGTKDGLHRATDVAVNGDGSRVYVVDLGGVDTDEHRVLVYGADGERLGVIGTRGTGDGEFNLPSAAAVAPDGTLYVLDAGNFRVQAFDPQGRFLRAFGRIGRGLGQFARPKAIAVDPGGRVYVADAAFGNVQIFDPQGRLLLPVGSASRIDGPGQFALLTGVAADEAGFVYLLDQVFRKVDVLRLLDDEESRRLQTS